MKTTRSLLTAIAVLVAGCAPNTQPIMITGIFPAARNTAGVCEVKDKPTVSQYRGNLDVGVVGGYDSFYAVLTVDSLFAETDTTDLGNLAVINEMRYHYTTAAGTNGTPIGGFSDETASVSFTVRAASKDNLVLVDMIGPAASQNLLNVPAGSPDEYFTLKPEVQFRGSLASGGLVQTNTVPFPIDIYNTASPCGSGLIINPDAPCGNIGQNLSCCVPDPMDPTKCKSG